MHRNSQLASAFNLKFSCLKSMILDRPWAVTWVHVTEWRAMNIMDGLVTRPTYCHGHDLVLLSSFTLWLKHLFLS